jgi:uncharacterized sporulation protein YeaH/YhbH (DUF444 family)
MAYVPVTPEGLEAFAQVADAYAELIRTWKADAIDITTKGEKPEMNGVQTLLGNLERELERARGLTPQLAKIKAKIERKAKKTALKLYDASKKKPIRRK